MPFYEYECNNWHKTERLRRIEDRNKPVECDECKEPAFPVLSPTPTTFRFASGTKY